MPVRDRRPDLFDRIDPPASELANRIYGTIGRGGIAREMGKPLAANPYEPGTYFHSLWQDGWLNDYSGVR